MAVLRRLAWITGVLALVASLACAYAAYTLAGYSWAQVVDYVSPFADYQRSWVDTTTSASSPVASAEATTTRQQRLVLVIVDGLELEASKQMSSLNTLREYGSDMVAVTPQPSLSFPTWTTILSGAPPQISGVTTNWFEGTVPVETLFDVAVSADATVVVSAPDDFKTMFLSDYPDIISRSYFKPWTEDEYMSAGYVTEAIARMERDDPQLVVIHLPDADETAHQSGADSEAYRTVVARIDSDIARLVDAVQDDRTTFLVCADHGHIAPGGHGGWEAEVTHVPAVFFGGGIRLDRAQIQQVDIAPTLAAHMGWAIPRQAMGQVLTNVIGQNDQALAAGIAQSRTFAAHYLDVVEGNDAAVAGATTYNDIAAAIDEGTATRKAEERSGRLKTALILGGAALLVLVLIGVTSWRALVAVLAGVVSYNVVYNGLYFVVHGYRWSLSAFNTETYLQTFFNMRMVEAVIAGIVATAVAGFVYPLMRRRPRGPRKTYLAGWLSLGPATVLAVQAVLAVQVAWFLWAYGAQVTWTLPNLKWGFKYDLDLIQATALGAAALLAPVVTYLVGRYHPKVRRTAALLPPENGVPPEHQIIH